jgi:RND family efflux transporter MFP subunit
MTAHRAALPAAPPDPPDFPPDFPPAFPSDLPPGAAAEVAPVPAPRRRWVKVTAAVVTVLVLAALGIGALTAGQGQSGNAAGTNPNQAAATAEWYRVDKTSFDMTVIAAGELEAKRQIEVKCQVKAKNPAIVEIVPEGTSVKQGQVLVKLDSVPLSFLIEQAELDLEKARADQVAAEQNLSIKKSEAESAHREAEVKLNLAELDLAKWERGELAKKRLELKLGLEKARRKTLRSGRDLELSKQLYAEKFISLGELEDDELAVIEAENEVATAELDASIFEQYTYPKERQQFNGDVQQAKEELDRVIRRNQSELARAEADLQGKTRTLKIRQTSYNDLQAQIASTLVTAPQDGLVVYGTSVAGRNRRSEPIAAGREVRYNETIVILPDTHQMIAVLRVHEAVLPQVTIGQTAVVHIDARSDVPMTGKVTNIAVMAEDGGWFNPDLREYLVRIELPDGADPSLKPAMRCSGEIQIGRVENALAVPTQAVFSEGSQRYVYVNTVIGRVRKQTVTLGRASEALVEITDGLSQGDKVLLRKPKPGEVVG